MAFYDNPIIDDNAHRSEESVNAVKSLFTSKCGFRCRDQNPDNGVDQNVELLNAQSQATGKLFGIQIKSTQSAKILDVNGQPYLVWQFKTSRLGYLVQYTPPGYGVVVMYVEETGKCYFDYAEDIVFRASEIRGSDEWQEQNMVDVHIPYSNVLTVESITEIYTKLVRRFQNHDLLLSEHGESFEIPVFTQSPSHVRKFPLEELEDMGIVCLIEANEFGKICQLLSSYKHAEIAKFKKVCLFGTYAWMQIGHAFEAKSLLMRCKRFETEFNSFEREVYIMIKHRLLWLVGDTTLEEFGRQMEVELASFQNPLNIINVRLTLLFFKVTTLGPSEVIKEEMDVELKSFFQEIETLDIKEKNKHLLILQYCEIVSGYINNLLGELAMLIGIRQKLGGGSLPEAQKLIGRITILGQIVAEKLVAVADYAEATDEYLLKAIALYRISRHFLHVQFNLALRGQASPLTVELRTDYEKSFSGCIHAHNQYIKNNQNHEAYLALHNAVDTILLFRLLYNEELQNENSERLVTRAQVIQDEFGFKPYESQIEEGLRVTTSIREHSEESKLTDATDAQLEIIARQVQESKQLPSSRIPNILTELKVFRRFDQVCQNSDIELLSNAQSVHPAEHLYTYPPSYKLRSRKTGLETLPSMDIEQLLETFRHLMRG